VIQELIYTSAPKGLKPGSRGFCTVASTPGMAVNLAEKLESLSGYRHVVGPHEAVQNSVAYSHLSIIVGGLKLHILSRIAAAGVDYSQRPNKLAHHLVLDAGELPPAGPAWLLAQPGLMRTEWDGEPRIMPVRSRLPEGKSEAAICHAWKTLTGDAGWGGVLAETVLGDRARNAVLIYKDVMDILPLVIESLALLPSDVRWQVTFSTYFTKLPVGVACQWRGVLAGTPEARSAHGRPNTIVIDLCRPLGAAKGGALVEAARSGVAPVVAGRGALAPSLAGAVSGGSGLRAESAPNGRGPFPLDDDGDVYTIGPPPVAQRERGSQFWRRSAGGLPKEKKSTAKIVATSVTITLLVVAVLGAGGYGAYRVFVPGQDTVAKRGGHTAQPGAKPASQVESPQPESPIVPQKDQSSDDANNAHIADCDATNDRKAMSPKIEYSPRSADKRTVVNVAVFDAKAPPSSSAEEPTAQQIWNPEGLVNYLMNIELHGGDTAFGKDTKELVIRPPKAPSAKDTWELARGERGNAADATTAAELYWTDNAFNFCWKKTNLSGVYPALQDCILTAQAIAASGNVLQQLIVAFRKDVRQEPATLALKGFNDPIVHKLSAFTTTRPFEIQVLEPIELPGYRIEPRSVVELPRPWVLEPIKLPGYRIEKPDSLNSLIPDPASAPIVGLAPRQTELPPRLTLSATHDQVTIKCHYSTYENKGEGIAQQKLTFESVPKLVDILKHKEEELKGEKRKKLENDRKRLENLMAWYKIINGKQVNFRIFFAIQLPVALLDGTRIVEVDLARSIDPDRDGSLDGATSSK